MGLVKNVSLPVSFSKYNKCMTLITNAKPPNRLGYASACSDDGDMRQQIAALAVCDQVFLEVIDPNFPKNRPQLDECMRNLKSGDTLIVWRLDRLGRSLAELVNLVDGMAKQGVIFKSLSEHIDTASGDIVLPVFSALAAFERNVMKERTRAGLNAARARGRTGGRPKRVTPKSKLEMKALHDERSMSITEICSKYKITRSTFYRAVLDRDYTKETS